MCILAAALLVLAPVQSKQEDVVKELSKKIDKILSDYSEKVRKDIDAIVREELKNVKFGPAEDEDIVKWKAALKKLAPDLKEDGVTGDFKKALADAKTLETVARSLNANGAPDAVIETLFEKGDDGKFAVKKEHEAQFKQAVALWTSGGAVGKPWIGVKLDREAFSDADRKALGLEPGQGVRLSDVTPGSPAEKAGLKSGDVVLKLGDNEVTKDSIGELLTRKIKVGEKLAVDFIREGKKQSCELTVGNKP